MTEPKHVAIGLRVPNELAQWLKRQALANQRSVSNQAAWLLDQTRRQQEDTQHAHPT